MDIDAFRPVRDFERALSEFTGAPFVVAVNSCTAALHLAFLWYKKNGGEYITVPERTYPSVPMMAHHSGLRVEYKDWDWDLEYSCFPSDIWDCARIFRQGMYSEGYTQCVSFHVAKHLKIGQGGAILHDNPEADGWYRRMRFDGRTERVPTKEDRYIEAGFHYYLSPDVAARGLWLLSTYGKDINPVSAYPKMSEWSWE